MRNANAPHPQGNGRGQSAGRPSIPDRDYTPPALSLEAVLPHLHKVQPLSDGSYLACCPAHDDKEPSLSLKEENGKLLWHCFAGCSQDAVQRALLNLVNRTAPRHAPQGLTLERYASAKQLPIDRLRAWGCEDAQYQQIPAVRIPYRDSEGNLKAVRYRIALTGENRFRWRTGDKPTLYGLWRLPEWQGAEVVYLCEGESDTHTLWSAGLPALGVPGASVWQAEWWAFLQPFSRVVVIPDRDEAGQHLLRNLMITCPEDLLHRVQVVSLPEGCKDVNALWVRERADIARFLQALQQCASKPLQSVSSLNVPPAKETETEPLWCIRTGRELVEMDFPLLTSLPLLGQAGFLYERCSHLLVAHPKAGKTQVLLHSAIQWLEQGKRIAILYEEPEALMANRLKTLPSLHALASEQVLFIKLRTPLTDRTLRALDAQLHADIYVVDTARAFLPIENENDNAELARTHYALVNANQEMGKTLIMLHHAPQELPTKIALRSAGGLATAGAYDMVIAIEQIQRGDDCYCRVEAEGRFAPPPPFEFRWENDTLVLNAVVPYREQLELAVIRALAQLHQRNPEKDYFPTAEIQGALEIDGNPTAFRVIEALQRLAEQGKVKESPTRGARNARLWRLVSVSLEGGILREETESAPEAQPPTNPFATRQALNPDPELDAILNTLTQGDFALEPADVDAIRIFWSFAQARGFPPLELPAYGYTLPAGREAYLNALYDLAGTEAIPLATRALQQRDSTGEPALTATQTQPADRGATPVQPTLM
ncbi:DNA primase [Armatimonadetes bacterium DC]|nr:DNA primase [Armatimonadetes bacterium DC]